MVANVYFAGLRTFKQWAVFFAVSQSGFWPELGYRPFQSVVTLDALENATKKEAVLKDVKGIFEERFKTGKNRWFFTKLRFWIRDREVGGW